MTYRRRIYRHPTSEAELQRQIWRMIIDRHPTAFIFHPVGGPYQTPGIPDLLICIDGFLIGMELKFPGLTETDDHARARATTQQRKKIKAINAAGGLAGVVISVAEAEDMLDRAERKRAAWKLREKE